MKQHLDTSLDAIFANEKSLQWLPFIGKEYLTSFHKVIIIGESHYVPKDEDPEFYLRNTWTREFILKDGLQIKPWNSSERKNNLIREVERTLVGEEQNTFWNTVAYFNLIQRLLPSIKGQDRPTYEDIVEGLKTFKKVFPVLNPDFILFCGVEAGKHFKNLLHDEKFQICEFDNPNYKINGCFPKSFTIETSEKIVNCYFVKHPSMAYSFDKWRNFIFKN